MDGARSHRPLAAIEHNAHPGHCAGREPKCPIPKMLSKTALFDGEGV